MSFILDALKKSENERQQQAPAEFATVPASPGTPSAPRWLWVIGILLAINVIALLAITLRPNSSPTVTPAAEQARSVAEPADTEKTDAAASPPTAFTDQLEKVRRELPDRPTVNIATNKAVATDTNNASRSVVAVDLRESASARTDQESNFALLPSLIELQLNDEVALPDLHVDIHVFSTEPSDRFVFINMNKYRENDQLSEGPIVREITRDGVILDYRGKAFSLPRE